MVRALKGSFDAMADRHAAQVLSAFTHAQQLILGHVPIKEKSNEIPVSGKGVRAEWHLLKRN